MALKGTLKDFGIADILQLIGQQQKSGRLHLKNKDQQVDIWFADGNIVKAESATRKKRDLIGEMLVRAELITSTQLEGALDAQRRTLQRLGDVMVAHRMLTLERFKQMVQLQANETLYRLFSWKSGTYQFEQEPVEADVDGVAPLRAESVLMEGFRMVDEWPMIRKIVSHYDLTFEVTKPLPPKAEAADDAFDTALDDAFAEEKREERRGEFKSLGQSERRIHGLVRPGRNVSNLIDVGCLGEFETCKALCNLVNLEYLKPAFRQGKAPSLPPTLMVERVWGALGRALVTLVVVAGLALIVSRLDFDSVSLWSSPSQTYADPAAQRFISRAQESRIEAALDVYLLEKGRLPERLEALVEVGLLGREDLRYPWRDPFYYRRTSAREFILLPPLR